MGLKAEQVCQADENLKGVFHCDKPAPEIFQTEAENEREFQNITQDCLLHLYLRTGAQRSTIPTLVNFEYSRRNFFAFRYTMLLLSIMLLYLLPFEVLPPLQTVVRDTGPWCRALNGQRRWQLPSGPGGCSHVLFARDVTSEDRATPDVRTTLRQGQAHVGCPSKARPARCCPIFHLR